MNDLTGRQKEIMALVAAGKTNQQIAAELNLSVQTIKNALVAIYGKLGAENRVSATLTFLGVGQ